MRIVDSRPLAARLSESLKDWSTTGDPRHLDRNNRLRDCRNRRRAALAAWDRAVAAYRTACQTSDRIDRETGATRFRLHSWPEEKTAWAAVADTDQSWRALSGIPAESVHSPFGTAQGL